MFVYGHLLISIKEILRSGEFYGDLLKKLQHADDYILDNTPIVDKQARMYDKLFYQPISPPIESNIWFQHSL